METLCRVAAELNRHEIENDKRDSVQALIDIKTEEIIEAMEEDACYLLDKLNERQLYMIALRLINIIANNKEEPNYQIAQMSDFIEDEMKYEAEKQATQDAG